MFSYSCWDEQNIHWSLLLVILYLLSPHYDIACCFHPPELVTTRDLTIVHPNTLHYSIIWRVSLFCFNMYERRCFDCTHIRNSFYTTLSSTCLHKRTKNSTTMFTQWISIDPIKPCVCTLRGRLCCYNGPVFVHMSNCCNTYCLMQTRPS